MEKNLKSFLQENSYPLIIILLTLLLYIFFIIPPIVKTQPLPTDAYRDIAYAQHVLNGNSPFSDPSIKGEYIWYPPLNPLIMALISKVTTIDLFNLYAYSPLYIQFFIPLLLFILLSRIFGKKIAFYSTLLIPVIPWLISHIFNMPMPSIHAFVVVLVILIYLTGMIQKGITLKRAAISGILMGIAFLHHSLSALILYGSVFICLLISKLILKRPYEWRHLLLILGIPLLLWAPYLLPNLFRQKLNKLPMEFISDHFKQTKYALHIPSASTFILTLFALAAGIGATVKKIFTEKEEKGHLLLLSLLAVTLIGQLLGYLHVLAESYPQNFGFLKGLPYIVPHEFQWFFQLFMLGFIALGIQRILEAHRIFNTPIILKRWALLKIITIMIFFLPAYIKMPENIKTFVPTHAMTKKNEPEYCKWLSKNSNKNAVCLTSNSFLSYFFIQPYTGRKIVYQLEGHTNFNVDAKIRKTHSDFFFQRAELGNMLRTIEIYDVDYLVIDRANLPKERIEFFEKIFTLLFNDMRAGVIILDARALK